MTRDDIIRMAREAGWTGPEDNLAYVSILERFAALVASAEREVCIDLVAFHGGPVDLEAAIRARGQE